MEILHISAECYPVAKAGGLGDVVGALPKYQTKAGHFAKVVMPMYRSKFLYEEEWVVDYKSHAYLGKWRFEFTIIKEKTNKLGFDLYLVDINGLLDRTKVYGYDDDSERFTAFQIAVLHWINSWEHNPNIVHCHDHHTALLPFMMQHCINFRDKLAQVPVVLTIHNAQYQGWMSWDNSTWIPEWDPWKWGLLDWKGMINPLACGIKCAWVVSTVSNSYMDELKQSSNGLESLFEYEKGKCTGILNGIDNEVWDPATDKYISHHYNIATVKTGKQKNKVEICEQFNLNINNPLFVFVGRLVGEKAAEILPGAISKAIYESQGKASFMVLGSGDPELEQTLNEMKFNAHFTSSYNCYIGYQETLSHQLYAAADFLLMPSRVEPCGLNQLYALRYGTIPMVRSTGGLKDTVIDMGEANGFGIRFDQPTEADLIYSIGRALEVYKDNTQMNKMRKQMMAINHSWENAVENYISLYSNLK